MAAQADVRLVARGEQAHAHALARLRAGALPGRDLHGRAGRARAPQHAQRRAGQAQADLRRSPARHVERERQDAHRAPADLVYLDATARVAARRAHDDDAPEQEAAVLIDPRGHLGGALDPGPVRPRGLRRFWRNGRARVRRVRRVRGVARIAGIARVAGVPRIARIARIARVSGIARRAAVVGRARGIHGVRGLTHGHHAQQRRQGDADPATPHGTMSASVRHRTPKEI